MKSDFIPFILIILVIIFFSSIFVSERKSEIPIYHAIVIWDYYIVYDKLTRDTVLTKEELKSYFSEEKNIKIIYKPL